MNIKKNFKYALILPVVALVVFFGATLSLNLKSANALVEIQEPTDGGTGGFSAGSGSIILKMWAVECDYEADLPNWNIPHNSYNPSTGAKETGGLVITESTIQNFVATHPTCRFADGWSFRYGKGENYPPVWAGWTNTNSTSGGLTIAYIPTSYMSDKWVEDYNTPWNPTGSYPIYEPRLYVSMLRGPGSTMDSHVGPLFVPVSQYAPNPNPFDDDPYSSEMRCYDDHTAYDNYEYVRAPSGGVTYSCVFFAALKIPPTPPPPAVPATLNVDKSECSVATWNVSSSNGYYASNKTTDSVQAGTYNLSASIPSSYTGLEVRNSDGGYSSLDIASAQTKTFYISCTVPDQPVLPTVTISANPNRINSGQSSTITWSSTNSVRCDASGSWSGSKSTSGNQSTGALSNSATYGLTCYNSANQPASATASVTVDSLPPPPPPDDLPLPACTVDYFPAQSEYNGYVYPTWQTSNSNNIVLSGGEFGSGIQVEPDGYRAISISDNVLLTVTANAGATCSPSASRSAWMYAEGEPMCTVSGKEYLRASDPSCTPDIPPPPCSFVNPYNGGDGFPDFSETGDGNTPINWYSNADSITLSGGPYSNYPVTAPNSDGYFIFPNISVNTSVTLTGNNGLCSNSSILYAAAVPPKPTPFTATPQACGTGNINLSWGEAPGSYNYIVYRNGTQIYSGPEWNPNGTNIKTDTGLVAGQTYAYSVIGQSPNGNTLPNNINAVAPAACPIPPTVSLSANPLNVSYNSPSTLTWNTSNADTCTASGGWTGSKPTGGTQSTGNLIANTTFTLTCTGPGGTSFDSKTITVGSAGQSDLTAYSPSTDTAIVGTPLVFSASVLNIGVASTIGTFNNFFQLADAANGGGTIDDLAPRSMQALDPNASRQADSPIYTFSSAGTYSVRICVDKDSAGDSGDISESNEGNNCSGWTNVNVNPSGPSFDYTLSRASGSLAITQGGSDTNRIFKNLSTGTGSSVDLNVSGLPAGSGISISYDGNRACVPTCSSVITFTAASNAPTGTYTIVVTGSPLNKTTAFTLRVDPSSALSATCNASVAPGGNKINQPVTWTASATGGSGIYTTWSWSGTNIPTSPAPSSNPYTITYSTTGTKTARATVTDSNGNQATCPDKTTIINFNPEIIEF